MGGTKFVNRPVVTLRPAGPLMMDRERVGGGVVFVGHWSLVIGHGPHAGVFEFRILGRFQKATR
jgi:hypothetical protein